MIISENLLLNSDGSLGMDSWVLIDIDPRNTPVATRALILVMSGTDLYIYDSTDFSLVDVIELGGKFSAVAVDPRLAFQEQFYVIENTTNATIRRYNSATLELDAFNQLENGDYVYGFTSIDGHLIFLSSYGLPMEVINHNTLESSPFMFGDPWIRWMRESFCGRGNKIFYGDGGGTICRGHLPYPHYLDIEKVDEVTMPAPNPENPPFPLVIANGVTDGTHWFFLAHLATYSACFLMKYNCEDLTEVMRIDLGTEVHRPVAITEDHIYCFIDDKVSKFDKSLNYIGTSSAAPSYLSGCFIDPINELIYARHTNGFTQFDSQLNILRSKSTPTLNLTIAGILSSRALTPEIYPDDGFDFIGPVGMEQEYTPEEPEEGDPVINKYQLSAHYKITYEQDTTDPIVYNELYAKFAYDDGNFDTLVIPLRIDIDIPSKTLGEWLIALGTITIDTSKKIVNIIVGVAQYNPTATFTITDITLLAMVDDAVEEAQYFSNVTYQQSSEYTNEAINDHLGDVHAALEAIIGE